MGNKIQKLNRKQIQHFLKFLDDWTEHYANDEIGLNAFKGMNLMGNVIDDYLESIRPEIATTEEQYAARFTCGENEIRPYLAYIFSNGDQLFATTGTVACIVCTDLELGVYDPDTLDKIEGFDTMSYPDLMTMIPTEINLTVKQKFKISELDVEVVGGTETLDGIKSVVLGDQRFSLDLIKLMANGSDEMGVRVSINKHIGSMFFLYDQPFEPHTLLCMSMGDAK